MLSARILAQMVFLEMLDALSKKNSPLNRVIHKNAVSKLKRFPYVKYSEIKMIYHLCVF
jgi:hypothetical protein